MISVKRSTCATIESVLNNIVTPGLEPRNFNKLSNKMPKLIEFLKGRNNINKKIVSLSPEIPANYLQVNLREGISSPLRGKRV